MKHILIAFGFVLATLPFLPSDASAYVCARGVYRAGCAGPNGAVVRRRAYVAPARVYVAPRAVVVAPRPVVVAPACRWIDGVRYCR